MATRVEFKDRIPSIIAKMPSRLEDDEIAIANQIATEARALAPRLNRIIVWPSFVRIPGYMAESIETADVPDGGTAVRVGAFYGLFVEYGTEHMRAQPYLRPAAAANEAELLDRVADTLETL